MSQGRRAVTIGPRREMRQEGGEAGPRATDHRDAHFDPIEQRRTDEKSDRCDEKVIRKSQNCVDLPPAACIVGVQHVAHFRKRLSGLSNLSRS